MKLFWEIGMTICGRITITNQSLLICNGIDILSQHLLVVLCICKLHMYKTTQTHDDLIALQISF